MPLIRARVLKVEDRKVTLGVFKNGSWRRIVARSEVPVFEGDWIEGEIIWPEHGTDIILKVKQTPSHTDGIDYEV